MYQYLNFIPNERISIRFTRIKTPISGEAPDKGWWHSLRFAKAWRREGKNSMRSFSLAATDAFLRALVYLRDPFLSATSFYRRRHWRQSRSHKSPRTCARFRARWPRGRIYELASSVLLRFKEPIKIPCWPTLWLTNGATCSRLDDAAW